MLRKMWSGGEVQKWINENWATPPRREWQGLTDEEIWRYWWDRPEVPDGEDDSMEAQFVSAVRAIEAKLKEKNA